jgi:hypothetical protein
MKGAIEFAESEIDDHDYDRWLDTLTEASTRLDALEAAVAEVRDLCARGAVSRDRILETFGRLGV